MLYLDLCALVFLSFTARLLVKTFADEKLSASARAARADTVKR